VKPIHNNSVVGSTPGTPALSASHLAQDPSSRGGAHPSQTFEQRSKPRVGAGVRTDGAPHDESTSLART
jgi:hypothetical protein